MSTAPVTIEQQIEGKFKQAWALLKIRLRPNRLAESDDNGLVLAKWLGDHGYGQRLLEMPLEELVDALYKAVLDLVSQSDVLQWEKEPVALKRQLAEQHAKAFEVREAQRQAKERVENTEDFFKRHQQELAKEQAKKEQEKEKLKAEVIAREIQSLILSIEENGTRPGTFDHAKAEQTRQYMFNFVTHRRQQRVPDETIYKELHEVKLAENIKRELERRWNKVPGSEAAPKQRRDSFGVLDSDWTKRPR